MEMGAQYRWLFQRDKRDFTVTTIAEHKQQDTCLCEICKKLEFGNPVAEYDGGLPNYFFVTDAFRYLISGKVDIIAGSPPTPNCSKKPTAA